MTEDKGAGTPSDEELEAAWRDMGSCREAAWVKLIRRALAAKEAEHRQEDVCIDCGAINRCHIKKYEMTGEVDLECNDCGSTQFECTFPEAISRLVRRAEKAEAELTALRSPLAPGPMPRTFEYLLNAMETAAQEKNPAEHGYAEKRKRVFQHVQDLFNLYCAMLRTAPHPPDDLR